LPELSELKQNNQLFKEKINLLEKQHEQSQESNLKKYQEQENTILDQTLQIEEL
jgi:hypothetical protein